MIITAHHTVAQFTHRTYLCTAQLKVNPSTKYKVMIKRYGPIVLTKTTYQRAGEQGMQQNTSRIKLLQVNKNANYIPKILFKHVGMQPQRPYKCYNIKTIF